MTASEFAFLALGLLLGIAVGAAVVEVLRSRPPAPHEVRVTVAPGSVPRRASTLSPGEASADPARGGPADHVAAEHAGVVLEPTTERSDLPGPGALADTSGGGRGAIAIESGAPRGAAMATAMADALRAAETRAAALLGREASIDAPVGALLRPSRASATALPAVASAAGTGGRRAATSGRATVASGFPAGEDGGPGADAESAGTATADEGDGRSRAQATPNAKSGQGLTAPAVDAGPCADARRIADERCALATAARERATEAATAVRDGRRRYEEHHERADRAADAGDPVRVRADKDAAQRAFRTARDAASTRADLEAAARTWLSEINRINAESRGATDTAARERAAAAELIPVLERLEVEADAARIAAESAEEACVAARDALADCEEAAAARSARARDGADGTSSSDPGEPPPASSARPGPDDDESRDATRADEQAAAAASGDALVFALLRGDRTALSRVAGAVADEDEGSRRAWTAQIAALVDAIVDRAIEASALDFPTEHFFWGQFTRAENRDVAAALGSLGFRFDGLGGWIDERMPTQRDLSLALSYAGLDPMRIRHWPNETETADLFGDVRVAADEYLAAAAGGLTLGELVSLLGRRAEGLTEVWNAWGRIRPALLEPAG